MNIYKSRTGTFVNIVCFRYANNISLGEEVLVDNNDQLIPAKVGNISILFMQGNTILANYLGIFIPSSNKPLKS